MGLDRSGLGVWGLGRFTFVAEPGLSLSIYWGLYRYSVNRGDSETPSVHPCRARKAWLPILLEAREADIVLSAIFLGNKFLGLFLERQRWMNMSRGCMKFLKELWPEEQIHLLGPRAALQVEGPAFQKVSRLAPDKLRQPDGVKLLVETLGGSWGKTQTEEKYHFFEQAIYQVAQKSDETNDSYLARRDAFFEELLARKVTKR